MTLWCYIKCLFKNPGILSELDILRESITDYDAGVGATVDICKKCFLKKIRRSHHCSICNKCIIKMDHHCLWINNCVGLYNQKFFILLTFYAFLMCCNCSVIIIYKIATCINTQPRVKSPKCLLPKKDIILIIVNTIISIIFGMFNFVMLVDQYYAIKTNTTGIEILKKIKRPSKPFKESLIEVFGHPFSYLWFFPIDGDILTNNFVMKEKLDFEKKTT
ncbi:palmitoyltransferase, putative [Hepatocystis sp. ex Piliocolobus tephrosceles]|nr:palmitoyltransferase, putative [Hepatocystis sp. ex Piliocolobus tephrosceles]